MSPNTDAGVDPTQDSDDSHRNSGSSSGNNNNNNSNMSNNMTNMGSSSSSAKHRAMLARRMFQLMRENYEQSKRLNVLRRYRAMKSIINVMTSPSVIDSIAAARYVNNIYFEQLEKNAL